MGVLKHSTDLLAVFEGPTSRGGKGKEEEIGKRREEKRLREGRNRKEKEAKGQQSSLHIFNPTWTTSMLL